MSSESRKDPRAKVLTMTVRYKSATLDEFIEHHSHDVSRGGMFIKTNTPFPPGTLLKFEVRIAEEQKALQGVGRVVWKREKEQAGDERPAGMGVKFIKIDDDSRRLIDRLASSKKVDESEYEVGKRESGARSDAPPPSAATPAKAAPRGAQPPRSETMVGLGPVTDALGPAEKVASIFPDADPSDDQPAPEDRTVMKQTAELLEDALRAAGGNTDELGADPAPKEEPAVAKSTSKASDIRKSPDPVPAEPGVRDSDGGSDGDVPQPSMPRLKSGKKKLKASHSPRRVQPVSLPPESIARYEQTQTRSDGKMIIWLVIASVVVVGGLVFALNRGGHGAAAAASASASASASAAAAASASAASAAASASASASAAASGSADPSAAPSASGAAAGSAAPSASAPASAAPAPSGAAPQPPKPATQVTPPATPPATPPVTPPAPKPPVAPVKPPGGPAPDDNPY